MSFNVVSFMVCCFGAVLVGVAPPCFCDTGEMPEPGQGETLGWCSAASSSETGQTQKVNKPMLLDTSVHSREDLVNMCYENLSDESLLEDCLVTHSESPTNGGGGWFRRKISQRDLDKFNEIDGKSQEILIKFRPMDIMDPKTEAMILAYKFSPVVDYNILTQDDLLRSCKTRYDSAHDDRYRSVKEQLNRIDGLTITRYLNKLDLLFADATLDVLPHLEAIDEIGRIAVVDNTREPVLDAVQDVNINVLESMQIHDPLFVKNDGSSGYDGDCWAYYGSWYHITPAILDFMGFRGSHVIFKDNASGDTRIEEHHHCTNSTCTQFADPEANSSLPGKEHGMKVAGVMLGDLRDEQDANFGTGDNLGQCRRSGQAPEAHAILVSLYGNVPGAGTNGINQALESEADLAVASFHHDPIVRCTGEGTSALAANNAYRYGMLTFCSAGDEWHTADCNTDEPGDAAAAFTVGALGLDSDIEVSQLNASRIDPASSRGGGSYYGGQRFRTIVDLAAPGRNYYHAKVDADNSYFNGLSTGNTSVATPRVAAAMVDMWHFMEYVNNEINIYLPGLQKVLMLGQGDRLTGHRLNFPCFGDCYATTGYNQVYGAGRAKIRRLDNTGMDNPWGYGLGYACVSNSNSVYLNINSGNALPADADDFKATLWWYTDDLDYANDIDVTLQRKHYITYNPPLYQWVNVVSDMSSDLKKRVYATGVGGQALRLMITGTDINATYHGHGDAGACASHQARAYYYYVWEDGSATMAMPAMAWADFNPS